MNNREFTSKGAFNSNFEREHEQDNSIAPASDFTTQPMFPMFGFTQQQFQPNYMNMPPQNQMFYNPYPEQYAPSYPSYGYGSSPYKNNKYYDKRGYQGFRKYSNSSPPTKHIIYSKKPKQAAPAPEGDLAEDFNKLSVQDNGSATANNRTEKLPSNIQNAQFFVIKSYSEEDVHKAIKYNVWCSTITGNIKLHEAFVAADNKYPIFLLFSVNSSGHFVGVAQMKSQVDFDKNFHAWNQNHKWKGVFEISWIYIKDVPNRELRHLKNEYNEGKPVPNSRDCQEVPFEIGKQVLEIFESYKNQTSILDDFDFYETKQPPK